MEAILKRIINENEQKSLIFVLGAGPREYFEVELPSGAFTYPSVQAVANSRHNVKIMFLDKLQYLFMYLTKFETESKTDFKTLVIYGLDVLLKVASTDSRLSVSQVRLTNLIYNISFRVAKRHGLDFEFVLHSTPANAEMQKLESYWRHISSASDDLCTIEGLN
ncbi:Shu1p Ecym_2437 [Eremothecium cymbalariae DBVPG|uniref:Uncharacterized protein n=1 Tax=Eremothecium cymbalariae (strain CBS 270.75 / DBVPG 7215 / KCTC 17166 / NRRL Y-17582) TaxID=931890 RepID=G8JPA9_ERECY|nr:Hypothetical protein Ecym_2437 [Eremothecium cymbalariae DBVPG\